MFRAEYILFKHEVFEKFILKKCGNLSHSFSLLAIRNGLNYKFRVFLPNTKLLGHFVNKFSLILFWNYMSLNYIHFKTKNDFVLILIFGENLVNTTWVLIVLILLTTRFMHERYYHFPGFWCLLMTESLFYKSIDLIYKIYKTKFS